MKAFCCRLIEVEDGKVEIDGYDITKVDLHTLRSRIAFVPQDTTLFLGTLRDNLQGLFLLHPGLTTDRICSDPQRLRTDAELIFVLQRAWLLPKDSMSDMHNNEAKFHLDALVGDEGMFNTLENISQIFRTFKIGSNYSAGEKQLLALGRALVKDSRIIILDEATSNVDVETDAKVQQTIKTEFRSSTLLCIAHRLNTIGKRPLSTHG